MSQWGAYGWAVDQNKSWQWILDHYYGSTTLGDVDTAQARIRVRLLGLGRAHDRRRHRPAPAPCPWPGQTARRCMPRRSRRTDSQIYASTRSACPGASSLVVPNGPIAKGSSDSAAVRQIQTFLNTFRISGDSHALGRRQLRQSDRGPPSRLARRPAADGDWDLALGEMRLALAQLIAGGSSAASWTLLTHRDRPGHVHGHRTERIRPRHRRACSGCATRTASSPTTGVASRCAASPLATGSSTT